MIEEIQKRPFVRLLLFGIPGILLAMYIPFHPLIGGVLFLPFAVISLSLFLSIKHKLTFSYNYRWTGGVVMALVVMSLAAMATFNKDIQQDKPQRLPVIEEKAVMLREGFVTSIDHLELSDAEKSFLATILLGHREALSRDVRNKFAATGISHILAVSGFHVAIVCGFIHLFLAWLPKRGKGKWIKYLLTMFLLWSFVVITGMAASAMRAGIMLSFYLTGRVLRRESDPYNTLAAAAFCMLIYNPYYLFDIGFQLSFTAVFFIVYLRPYFEQIAQVRNPVVATPWQWLTVCLSAQIGTTFLSLYYFRRFSFVFVLANLPVMLFSTLLIPLGLFWLLLPSFVPGYGWVQAAVEWLTHQTIRFVDLLYRLPGISTYVDFDLFSLVTGYLALFSGMAYLFKRRPWLLILTLSLFVILSGGRLLLKTGVM